MDKNEDSKAEILVAQKRSLEPNKQQERIKINPFVVFLCYIGELIFYPIIMLILYLIFSVIQGIIFVVVGALMAILIPFFPFYLICCCCGQNGMALGSLLCGLSALSVIIIVAGALSIAFSPLVALWQFFYVFYLIFTGKVSPYYSFDNNWTTMTRLMTDTKELTVKYYSANKQKFKMNKQNE